ncbi:hypothetical protein GCM10023186_00010 [Hymenobacter koreensis]|uniref:Uncharacterized protein n=1 Tax=Hymenobacter koreensis TaxID=1084523 RepID=A0ABP8ITN5_9BACT
MLPRKSVVVVDSLSIKVVAGNNHVLVFQEYRVPIYKPGQGPVWDIDSSIALFLELDTRDSIVTAANPGHSKLYRYLNAFSPDLGAHALEPNEDIKATKLTSNRWVVVSNLKDLPFQGEFSFADSSSVTTSYDQLFSTD